MARITRFEDLQSWQKARELVNMVYNLSDCPDFVKGFHLREQIQDAAGSIMHNIAEGFDCGSNAEFIRFLKIARRSASEVQSELYLALDRAYLTQEQLTAAYALATDAKKLINGMIGHLRESQPKRYPTS